MGDGFNVALFVLGAAIVGVCSTPAADPPKSGQRASSPPQIEPLATPKPGGLARDEAAEHFLALVMLGEAAHQSDAEVRAIVGVVLNRWQSGAYGTTLEETLMFNRRGVYAFTALDPVRAQPRRNVFARDLPRTKAYKRLRRIIREEIEGGTYALTKLEYYYHPKSMTPKGFTPRWAVGAKFSEIGSARFFTRREIQKAAARRSPPQASLQQKNRGVHVADVTGGAQSR